MATISSVFLSLALWTVPKVPDPTFFSTWYLVYPLSYLFSVIGSKVFNDYVALLEFYLTFVYFFLNPALVEFKSVIPGFLETWLDPNLSPAVAVRWWCIYCGLYEG